MVHSPGIKESAGIPRWVVMSLVVAGIVALGFVTLMATGVLSGAQHGNQSPPAGETASPGGIPPGHTPPPGLHGG